MVRVTTLPVRQDDDAGTEAAQNGGDLQAVFERVLYGTIRQVERLAMAHLENSGGGFGLGLAFGCAAAGTGLRLGSGRGCRCASAKRLLDEQGAAAGLLHVVAVRGDGEDVDVVVMRSLHEVVAQGCWRSQAKMPSLRRSSRRTASAHRDGMLLVGFVRQGVYVGHVERRARAP